MTDATGAPVGRDTQLEIYPATAAQLAYTLVRRVRHPWRHPVGGYPYCDPSIGAAHLPLCVLRSLYWCCALPLCVLRSLYWCCAFAFVCTAIPLLVLRICLCAYCARLTHAGHTVTILPEATANLQYIK